MGSCLHPFPRCASPGNLGQQLVDQLHQGLTQAVAEPDARVVVLDHTGGTFCAGADLRETAGR
ncbi:enoyl-CoA hydratase-related protein, partial [Mycolicibacterium holsaticum]|uniref:enoyl-CoA hydratase-related protein n=1 Tax=Mycolicibacterium holsaticum TaxID=152142 RepID=UPI003B8A5F74